MKQVTSATFRDTFTELKEPVQVRRYNTVLGTWTPARFPISKAEEVVVGTPADYHWEAPVEEPVKKAIESDKIKVRRGEVRKGLGDLPGESIDREALLPGRDPYKEFRPAPKKDK